MEKMDREAALDAIDELVDRQTAVMIKATRIDPALSEEIHQCNMAWRELAKKIGGLEVSDMEQLRRHFRAKGE